MEPSLSRESEMTASQIDDGVKPTIRPASNPEQSGAIRQLSKFFLRGAEQRLEKNFKELLRPSAGCRTLPLSPRAVYPFARFAGAERTALRKAAWLNIFRMKSVAARGSASAGRSLSRWAPAHLCMVFPIIPSDYRTYPSWYAIPRVKRKRTSRLEQSR